ncbi:MAG: hypothetical protein GY894_11650 [Planctomycetes bacterium]|nr:hypothetical protein [Planctomycetota bacterium]MCP4839992.1 hypothetical protein [Planctomycetota bacterium]
MLTIIRSEILPCLAAITLAGILGVGAVASALGSPSGDGTIGSLPIQQILHAAPIPGGGQIDPVPWGNGGTYGGPGDIVPPGAGEHTIGMCTMELPPTGCATDPQCDLGWEWTLDDERCVWPRFGPGSGLPHVAQGYMFTIADVVAMLQPGSGCIDWQGNITICVDAPFDVHEVHVFQSGWINGYVPTAAIENAVSTKVCIGGETVMAGWSFEELAEAQNCDFPTVCITFSAECMMAALRDWAASGLDPSQWAGSWLFYVDFVSCTPCD